VLKRIDAGEKTARGIIIPDTAREKPQQSEVIAAAPGHRDDGGKLVPMEVKAGDRMLFGKWSGTEVSIDGIDAQTPKQEHP
jgi:chaperonin GroES